MPKPDIITQAELASVLHDFNELRYRILGIRRRIECNAATVEEGIYTADSNPGDPISGHRAVHGSSLCGLDIETKERPSDIYDEPAAPKESEPTPSSWLNETPTMDYTLEATSENGIQQSVEMTLEEYEAPKEHLCRMRGYNVPVEVRPCVIPL